MNKLKAFNQVIMAKNIMEDRGLVASTQYVKSLKDKKPFNLMVAYIKTHGFEQTRQEIIRG